MDHAGDMARYINESLKANGYGGLAADYESLLAHEEWIIHDDGSVTLTWVWGKDSAFEITIRDAPPFRRVATSDRSRHNPTR